MDGAGIRSLLFAPGDDEAKALKALGSAADAVILDLEDAVAPEAKAAARNVVRAVLDGAERRGKPLLVRINAFDTALAMADLAAVVGGRPWGIVLPKCRDMADLLRLGHCLDALEAREEIAPGHIRLLPVATETAAATLNLAVAHTAPPPRLWGAMWGAEDLAAALGASANRDAEGRYTPQFQFARSQCLYAANALGVVAVDAVHTAFRDLAALETETGEALRDGFTAKAAIHPAQAAVINRVLTPAPEALAWAREVMLLLATAGVARLDGRMIDIAHKRVAARLLARADAIALAGSAGTP